MGEDRGYKIYTLLKFTVDIFFFKTKSESSLFKYNIFRNVLMQNKMSEFQDKNSIENHINKKHFYNFL